MKTAAEEGNLGLWVGRKGEPQEQCTPWRLKRRKSSPERRQREVRGAAGVTEDKLPGGGRGGGRRSDHVSSATCWDEQWQVPLEDSSGAFIAKSRGGQIVGSTGSEGVERGSAEDYWTNNVNWERRKERAKQLPREVGWRKEFFKMEKTWACLGLGDSKLRWVVQDTKKKTY